MAFFAGLMANQAGYGQGKNQAYQDAIALSTQQQQQAEQVREFNENLKLQQAQLGIDPATGQPAKPVIPKQFSQISPHNKGVAATPEDYVRHYLSLAAANVGNPSVSQAFANIASQFGLGAERSANAAYTAGPKTAQGYAGANLADAHAEYILKIQPKEFAQKVGEDRDKYMAQIASRQELAQYNAGARMQIAAVSAYYRLQGQSQENAFRAALDEYNQGQQTYRTDTRDSLNPLSPSFGMTPQAPGAPVSFPYTNPNNITINLGDVVRAINGEKSPGKKPTAPAPANDQEKQIVDALVSGLHGRTDAASQISKALAAGAITQSEAHSAAARLGVHLSTAPTSTSFQLPSMDQALGIGGGSNAGAPFP